MFVEKWRRIYKTHANNMCMYLTCDLFCKTCVLNVFSVKKFHFTPFICWDCLSSFIIVSHLIVKLPLCWSTKSWRHIECCEVTAPLALDDMSMSMSQVRDLAAPMHLGLINWPFVPHVQSREPWSITEAPDGPQAYTLNILRLQEKGAQMCMSEWGQGLTFTKNMGQGFLHHPTFPTQWTVLQSYGAWWSEWLFLQSIYVHPLTLRRRTTYIYVALWRSLTLRRLMSYIYGAPILDVSRSHITTQHSR